MSTRTESRETQALREALGISFRILKVMILCVLILFLFSGFFVVKQDEVALVFRFGKMTMSSDSPDSSYVYEPGFKFSFPYPVDKKVKLPGPNKVFGFEINDFWMSRDLEDYLEGMQKEKEIPVEGLDLDKAGYCLTGDMNVVHSKWTVRFSIADPVRFYERVSDDPTSKECLALVKSRVLSAIIREFGRHSLWGALTTDIDQITRAVNARAQLELADVGVELRGIDNTKVDSPACVQPSSNKVIAAFSEKAKLINEAKKYRSKTLNEAKGEAERIREEALGYKTRLVKEAGADAAYLDGLLTQYTKKKDLLDIYVDQYYQEVLSAIISNSESRYLLRYRDEGEQELRLLLSPIPRKFGSTETQGGQRKSPE